MESRKPGGNSDVSFYVLSLEMEMANSGYPQQHAPPNQTAPWPDRMMAMDHYGNQSRYGFTPPQSNK